MNTSKNKIFSIGLLTLLILASGIVASLQFVAAHDPPWDVPTYAYIVVSPNPVGVDQTAFIVMWINWPPPSAAGSGGDRWQNYMVEITKPDGSTESKGPFMSEATSAAFFLYTPSQTGTYSFDFSFPGQVASLYNPVTGEAGSNSAYVGDNFLGSSASTTLTVQEEPIERIPETPLPTEYWTRPIEAENSNWYTIASNWLGRNSGQILGGGNWGGGGVQPDGLAPNSPHIMWTKPLADGGIVGGSQVGFPGQAYYMGLSYEGRFSNPIVIYGRLYYDTPLSNDNNDGPYTCVDLRTGETLWTNIDISPSFGQLYSYESPNQHGVIPDGYLWQTQGSTWIAIDPRTAEEVFRLTDVPSGTTVYGPNGEITRYHLEYNTTTQTGWLGLWNNTAAPGELGGSSGSAAWQWRPVGKEIDASTAYSWNVSVSGLIGESSPQILSVVPGDVILGTSTSLPSFSAFGSPETLTFWAISLKDGTKGQLKWIRNMPAPAGNLTMVYMGAPSSGSKNVQLDAENRVWFLTNKETMQWWGFDLDFGNTLWGPTGDFRDFQYYGVVSNPPAVGYVYNGNLYVSGYGGILNCFESRTGNLLWTYGNGGPGNSTNSGEQTPWGNYPLFPCAFADGKIYLFSSEHSPNTPQYKGARVRCVDATTGEELWTLLSWYGIGSFGQEPCPVADGYLVYLNTYDMQIYCIGKGPSATTVSVAPEGVAKGSTVLVRGTVSDVSAGAKKLISDGKRAAVGAVSDESMGPWMEYLYMQKPKPEDTTGVNVKLTAVNCESGSQYDIGTAVTDGNGNYGYSWMPPDQGTYYVMAEFEGSDSYFASDATAYVAVGPSAPVASPTATVPPMTTAPPTTTTPPPTTTATPTESIPPTPTSPGTPINNDIYIIAAVAVVIIIVAAVAAVFLRRRK